MNSQAKPQTGPKKTYVVDSHAYLKLYVARTVNKVLEQLGFKRSLLSLPVDSCGESGDDADTLI